MPTDAEYKIVTAGGRENGPLDVDTIRGLYLRKLIDENTLVFSPSRNQWARLAEVFDVAEWSAEDVVETAASHSAPIPQASGSRSDEPISISGNIKPAAWDSHSSYKEAGCFSVPVIGILIVFMVVIFLLTGRLGIPGPLLWLAALSIVGWFATIRYRRNMERRLGRKIKGEHELTSISSWMEAESKEKDASSEQ